MEYLGKMCPQGLALHYAAAGTILKYTTRGCPLKAGRPSRREEMEVAMQRSPHALAMEPEEVQQLHEEVQEKVATRGRTLGGPVDPG